MKMILSSWLKVILLLILKNGCTLQSITTINSLKSTIQPSFTSVSNIYSTVVVDQTIVSKTTVINVISHGEMGSRIHSTSPSIVLVPSSTSVSNTVVVDQTTDLSNLYTISPPIVSKTTVINVISRGGMESRIHSTLPSIVPVIASLSSFSISGVVSTSSSSTVFSISTTTTKPQKQNVVLLHKFKSSGVFRTQNTTTTDANITTNALQEKFAGFLQPYGQINSSIIAYNSNDGEFIAEHFFNSSYSMDRNTISELLRKDAEFSSILVQEQCTPVTCGKKSGRCFEDRRNVYCHCNIGFWGERCTIPYAVDGHSYGPWSNWTDCGISCQQKRFRYCYPDPKNGGKCILGPNPFIEFKTCFQCERNDQDGHHGKVAIVVLAIFILILVLLIAFCCTHKLVVPANDNRRLSKSGSSRADASDFIRTPYAIVRTSVPQRENSRVKSSTDSGNVSRMRDTTKSRFSTRSSPYSIQMREIGRMQGVDNMGYTEHDRIDAARNNEDLYKKQLDLFFSQAPGLSKDGIAIGSPELHRVSPLESKAIQSPELARISPTKSKVVGSTEPAKISKIKSKVVYSTELAKISKIKSKVVDSTELAKISKMKSKVVGSQDEVRAISPLLPSKATKKRNLKIPVVQKNENEQLSFTPALQKRKEIESKCIDHGPIKHTLAMV